MPKRSQRITIVDALADRRLFGALPAFRDLTSWRAWLVFLSAVYGLPLASLRDVGLDEADALRLFCTHTGRTRYDPPAGGWPEVVAIVGRQSGKTRIGGTIAGFEAMTATPEQDGTDVYAALVAQDQRGALRSLLSYARAPFDRVPILSRSVRERRADSVALESGCTLAVYPCRPQSLRGIRARVIVCDELAFFRSSEGYPTDTEMVRAVRPTLATTGGKAVFISSPYGQAGALWDLYRRHYGRDDAPVLIWQGAAGIMNPTLPADYLARMETDDPEAFRSEVLGEFRPGLSTFLDPDALAACVDEGIRERPSMPGVTYVAGFDASGGRNDRAALAIAHTTGNGCATLDLIRAWGAPHDPARVIAEACETLKPFPLRNHVVVGDKYAAEFVTGAFRQQGVTYQPSERDRSGNFLELLPLVQAGRVRLLDDGELLKELRSLERRRGATRDRVDHRPGAHDDRAVAATVALVQAATARTPMSPEMMQFILTAGNDDPLPEWQPTLAHGRDDEADLKGF